MIIVKSRDSLLTTTSGYTNYRGILNLVIILLVLSNARAALENIIKYGILVDPLSWFTFLREGSKHWPALLIVLGLGAHILISLGIELIIARIFRRNESLLLLDKTAVISQKVAKNNSPKAAAATASALAEGSTILFMANATIVANLFACISLPPIAVYSHDTHPISTSAALMLVSIVFLKLVSYHMMNFWCRDVRRPEKLQSRTTKSFLRSYTPPAVDFGVIKPKSLSPSPITTAHTQGEKTKSNSPEASKTSSLNNGQMMMEPELRQRLPINGNTNNINNNNNHSNRLLQLQQQLQTKEAQYALTKQMAIEGLSKYPENVSLQNMCSYLAFPTLCYELEYAQTERIRKRFLIKRIIELIVLSQLDMALIQQWIVPTVNNSMLPFRQMQFSHMLERLLKLAVPNHVIWLIWFYLFFHSLLNIVAELTRFADREFYRDWWNSESVSYFWSNWNIPVHKWCARHLYVPLMAFGATKCQASTAVFFVSAFFHEYLVSVPLKMFRMWAFTGMLIQLPWARFVSAYFNNHFANVAVWVSLIIGQPLAILMYYHDYYVINKDMR